MNVFTLSSFAMNRTKMLDGDTITFNASHSKTFFAIQPHEFQGSITTELEKNGSVFSSKHAFNEQFFISNYDSIKFKYTGRGGSNVNYWQIPEDFCDQQNVVSVNQRSAEIKFSTTNKEKMCWFLSFRENVSYNARITGIKGNLIFSDNQKIQNNEDVRIHEGENKAGVLSSVVLVAFHKEEETSEPTEVVVTLNSSSSFGDWTSSPAIFNELTEDGIKSIDSFDVRIVPYKLVAWWIWITICSCIVVMYVVCYFLFFIRPKIEKKERKKHE